MRQNLDRLWAGVYPGGGPGPAVDPADIRRRVNAALDAVPPERKRHMRQKIRFAAALAAALITLAGTALAVYRHYIALDYFEGDTALIEPSVQPVDQVLENGSYRVRVDSVLADADNTILGLSIEALTDEARSALNSERFSPSTVVCYEPETTNGAAFASTFTSGRPEGGGGLRSFSIHLSGVGAPNTFHLYFKGDAPGSGVALTLEEPLESRSVRSEVPLEGRASAIRSCTLNAMGVTLDIQYAEPVKGDRIVAFCFRMADGSLKTLAQLNGGAAGMNGAKVKDAPGGAILYRRSATFHTPIDPLTVAGVLMNGMEYSFLDPEYAVPAEIPEALRPFLIPFHERDDAFYFSAADLCGHAGAGLEREGRRFTLRTQDHTLTLLPGESAALLDGEPLPLELPAILEGDDLLLSRDLFRALGLENSMYYPEPGPVHAPEFWLVTP